MKLECDTFYFYPNGGYKTSRKKDSLLKCYDNDIKEYSQAIRIFGTRKQIDKALDNYCDISGLNLNEVYDFEDKDKLKEYAQHYKNKALIINLR
eukprot:COSAG01_NODE_2200_length_8176_cov_3.326606_20_plen_94_part_00